MDFPGFYGNAQAKALVSSWIDSGRVPQAILLEGEKGLGKRTLARLIAAACVCEDEARRPCTACNACRKALTGGHADIMIVEGGAAARSFGVDKIRAVRSDASILPNEAERKLYLLFQAHQMTEQAQNALLKILEEPPAYAHFILTCESARSLLETVRSRTAMIRLAGVEEEEAVQAVCRLEPKADPQAVRRAVQLWGGNIGRTLQTICGGALPQAESLAKECLAALFDPKETALLCASAPLIKDKELSRIVYGFMLMELHDGFLHPKERQLTAHQRLAVMDCVRSALDGLDRYVNQTLLVTQTCAAMRQAAGR